MVEGGGWCKQQGHRQTLHHFSLNQSQRENMPSARSGREKWVYSDFSHVKASGVTLQRPILKK